MANMLYNREHIPGINNAFGTENDAETSIDFAFRMADEATAPQSKRGEEVMVCAATEIPRGGKKIVEIGKNSIGIFNIMGTFYAIKNNCPHQGAPLCRGNIQTTYRPSKVNEFCPGLENRVIRCPWHGWEFDIISGKALYDRKSRVATYPVRVDEEGNILVKI